MPWTFDINTERRRVTYVMTGTASADDIREAIGATRHHARWKPGFSEIWDACGLEEAVIEAHAVRSIVEHERAFSQRESGGRIAIVTECSKVRALVVTLLVLYGEGHRPHRIFTARDEAEAWLDLEQTTPPPSAA